MADELVDSLSYQHVLGLLLLGDFMCKVVLCGEESGNADTRASKGEEKTDKRLERTQQSSEKQPYDGPQSLDTREEERLQEVLHHSSGHCSTILNTVIEEEGWPVSDSKPKIAYSPKT